MESNPKTSPDAAEARLTTGQAAQTLGVSADRVRQLAKEGRLPFVRTTLGRLYERDAVVALATRRLAERTSLPATDGQ